MTPRRLLASARRGARPRRTLVLEVANPPAVEAFLGAATVGACPCVDSLRASPGVGGVLALFFGPRAPTRDEPLVVVVSAHVGDPGADEKT